MEKGTTLIIIAIIAVITFIFAARELAAWYWKINKRIMLQEETNKLLTNIWKALDPLAKAEMEKKSMPLTGKDAEIEALNKKFNNNEINYTDFLFLKKTILERKDL